MEEWINGLVDGVVLMATRVRGVVGLGTGSVNP